MSQLTVSYDPEETLAAVAKIKQFLESYTGRRKVFLLIGRFGSGKTWCLRQIAGNGITDLSLALAEGLKQRYGDRFFKEIAGEPPQNTLATLGEALREEFHALVSGSDTAFIDNVEILYSYPYFDFVKEAESASERGTKVVLAIPGYISQNRIYFIDKHLFNLQIGPTRIDRYFELKGVRK